MIESYLTLVASTFGGFVLLTALLFAGRNARWLSRPPAVDLVITLYTMVPWIIGWETGRRIHHHWSGGLAGLAVVYATQIFSLEIFDFLHTRAARHRHIPTLEINRTLGRRFGSFRNRFGLWGTVPSIPFFLLNRVGQYTSWYPLVWVLGFTRLDHAKYISVSRHKIRNLAGADLVWCLYCDWMTGGWSLTSEMLNEVESYWCPLAFADKEKCEKCSEFFRMGHWVPADASAQQVQQIIGIKGGGRLQAREPVCESGCASTRASRVEASVDK